MDFLVLVSEYSLHLHGVSVDIIGLAPDSEKDLEKGIVSPAGLDHPRRLQRGKADREEIKISSGARLPGLSAGDHRLFVRLHRPDRGKSRALSVGRFADGSRS